MVPAAAAPSDQDTVCATVYTFLAQEARSNGQAADGFEQSASRAENVHMANNRGQTSERYALDVIDGAQTLRDALARGTLSANAIIGTASECNARYGN